MPWCTADENVKWSNGSTNMGVFKRCTGWLELERDGQSAALHSRNLGLGAQDHMNQAWWHMPGKVAMGGGSWKLRNSRFSLATYRV